MTLTEHMRELLKNESFKILFLDKFLKDDIIDNVFTQPIDAQETIDKLKARQELRNFIDMMLSNDEMSNLEKGED